jgi:DNA-directed RNA polymerase specialized sigma24 family protein
MEALAASLSAGADAVSTDTLIEREFNERLAECSALAFRVALGVLRNRADAEDVAQEAFLRAYRNFSSLRERSRFRACVRITWRLAIDRWRSARRRLRCLVQDAQAGPRSFESGSYSSFSEMDSRNSSCCLGSATGRH